MGEKGDDKEEEEWKLDLPMNPCQWKIDDAMLGVDDIFNHCIIMPWELKVPE